MRRLFLAAAQESRPPRFGGRVSRRADFSSEGASPMRRFLRRARLPTRRCFPFRNALPFGGSESRPPRVS
ncbi:hypothetical protein HRbin17_01332 [bacterium HR17]|uniref:Uncharacterized protein n=1 Tax=Candidatus Fervidibacter japonicus TaxID=2035412 RepID=A0A2H5XCF7_9BACT|nr:hypothetical protein HRbin17_01332 [bacterium HR17]